MTEKNYNPKQKESKAMKKQDTVKKEIVKTPIKKTEEVKPTEEKKEIKPVQKQIKKDFAVVNIQSCPVSTKVSMAICKFIKNKKIEDMIKYLEGTMLGKNVIPMKGEIPHRKGKVMSGRYPKNASKRFIVLLKSLLANSIQNGIENPIIVEAIPNLASRPYAKGGRAQKKRTHIRLVAKEKKENKK
jgi:ribosomal protein L22